MKRSRKEFPSRQERPKRSTFAAHSSERSLNSAPLLPDQASRFLIGDVDGSKEDLQSAIDIYPASTQSLVKIASVHMEQGDAVRAFECFEEAIKHNPNDPDIYYHRGQGADLLSTTHTLY